MRIRRPAAASVTAPVAPRDAHLAARIHIDLRRVATAICRRV
ncbi:putative leader peptide [Streptomyces sp. NPDC102406]